MGLRIRLIAMLVFVMAFAFMLLLIGVNFGLRSDVHALAQRSVDAGANALAAAVDARAEQVRSIVLQASAQTSLADAIVGRNTAALRTAAADVALAGNLSFVVVTDPKGVVLAGSRAASGSLGGDPVFKGAADGVVAGGVHELDGAQLRVLGVSARPPALAIVMASPVNVGGKTLGVLYGGQLIDAGMKAVDDVSRFTGGETGVVLGGALAATSLAAKDGAKETGLTIEHAAGVLDRSSYSGEQQIDGTDYYVKLAPLSSFDGRVLGAYWFGVPFAQFDAIVADTLRQIVLWGALGLAAALTAGAIFASRIGRAISRRSEEVNESAQQLKVLVVGGEVSGDHVGRTREALEEIESLVSAVAPQGGGGQELRELTRRAVDDVVVIDTLTTELSTRMRDAAIRVERLSAVAQELDELVAGTRPSSN